jgi:hypothetical protein
MNFRNNFFGGGNKNQHQQLLDNPFDNEMDEDFPQVFAEEKIQPKQQQLRYPSISNNINAFVHNNNNQLQQSIYPEEEPDPKNF